MGTLPLTTPSLSAQDDRALTLPSLEPATNSLTQPDAKGSPSAAPTTASEPVAPRLPPVQRGLFDDRSAAPRLGPVPAPALEADRYQLSMVPALGREVLDKLAVTGIGRILFDSTRLSSEFAPGSIPVEGQDFFEAGWRANVSGNASIVSYDIQTNTNFGTLRGLYVNDFIDRRDGDFGYRLRHAYGQLGRLTAGQTFSLFTDVDALEDRVSAPDPPAALYLLQPSISYRAETAEVAGRWLTAGVALGATGGEIDNETGVGGLQPYSRFPDLVMAMRRSNRSIGYLQVSSLLRDLAIQSGDNVFDDQALGWAVQLSGGLLPEEGAVNPRDLRCRFGFSVAYGEGYGRYHTDLNRTSNDAVIDATGRLHARPLFTCRASYSRPWGHRLRSTIIAGYTELDSVINSDPFAYRRTHFAQANAVYLVADNVFMGVDYFFGYKQTLNGADGTGQRVAFVVGVVTK